MKIAFIHYHLKPGGVTTVIRQQMNAIQNDCEVITIAGERPDGFPTDVIPVPGIAYDHTSSPPSLPEDTAAAIMKAIYNIWPNGCDIIHIHNPTLAKNRNFLKVVKILQQKGFKLLLQIHDFSEDGRPLSYFSENYPEDCHYCVINSRDYRVLTHAGLVDQGLHLLPNMVNPINFKIPECSIQNYVLYPVRAIRRKNIGEAILLSIFFKHKETLAITLPPNSPIDVESCNDWKKYVSRQKLHVEFEFSSKYNFSDLVCGAKFIITTSINEGFGFSFLEPWTANKILWGRNIPDICIDFQKKGIQLENLYTRINIPVDWLNRAALFSIFQSTIERNCKLFGYPLDSLDLVCGFEEFIQDNCVDFGMLNEPFQQQIVSRIMSSPKDKTYLISINPFLSEIDVSYQQPIVDHNKKIILADYNTSTYRQNLLQIYDKVRHVKIVQAIDKEKLLFQFLTPSRLNLLKWSEYERS